MKHIIIFRVIAFFFSFVPTIAWSAIGDTFEYIAPEGVNLTFKITSETGKTVQFGTGKSTYASIDRSFAGSITIPSDVNGYHVTEIAAYAFYNCKSLTEIIIPDDVTSIGAYAFSGCRNLKRFQIPEGVTKIDKYTFEKCSSLSYVYLPDNITNIYTYAFDGCSSLTEIDLPENLNIIASYAFRNCEGIGKIIIPENTTKLGEYCFKNCKDIQEVTIGKSVKTISNYCFYGCTNIKAYYTLGSTPASASTQSFSNTTKAILYVPNNNLNSYKNAEGWKKFTTIVGIDIVDDGIKNPTMSKEIIGYYTLDGIPIKKPLKGIYIIKHKDGRTQKVKM